MPSRATDSPTASITNSPANSPADSPADSPESCLFCRIVAGTLGAALVATTEHTVAFLDHRPVFPGHVLIVPKIHYSTLTDLPGDLVQPLFAEAQRMASAVERLPGAEGTWVSMNNRVSQSVPHLHVHVIPRRKGDGLRGFYWPRVKYPSAEVMHETAALIATALYGRGGVGRSASPLAPVAVQSPRREHANDKSSAR